MKKLYIRKSSDAKPFYYLRVIIVACGEIPVPVHPPVGVNSMILCNISKDI